MFFSKFAFAGLALLSTGTSVFASPVAFTPSTELAIRGGGDDCTSVLNGWKPNALATIDAFVGVDVEAEVKAIVEVFAEVKVALEAVVIVEAEVDALVAIVVDVLVELFAKLDAFVWVGVDVFAEVDVAVGALIDLLESKHHGFGHACGQGLINVGAVLRVVAYLKLVVIAKVCALVHVAVSL
ncbi:hypothetical protein C8Q75DRAFT_489854 [Abortiporus biennis]|nr:hypothetical protein C8Q75DRAFT_489854 [Abortiporus biennis]